MRRLSLCLLGLVLPGMRLLASAPPEAHLAALKARSIGPAVMGGRVSEIALDPESPYTFYVGLATGGMMKTSNNGATCSGIFEKEAVASIARAITL